MKKRIAKFFVGTAVTGTLAFGVAVCAQETAVTEQIPLTEPLTEASADSEDAALADDAEKEKEAVLTMDDVRVLLSDRQYLWENLETKYTGEKIIDDRSEPESEQSVEIVQYKVEDDYAIWLTTTGGETEVKSINLVDLRNTGYRDAVNLQTGDLDEFLKVSRIHRSDDPIEKLYLMQTEKVDESQCIYMLIELAHAGLIPEDEFGASVNLIPSNGVYRIHVNISDEMGGWDFYDPEEWDQKLMTAGNILLAINGDVEEIKFSYPLESGEEYHLYWDLEAAETSLNGGDVKSYADSPEKFRELAQL